MPFAQLSDIRLYYERAGGGPPLLLINGTGADLRVRQAYLPKLAQAFDLLAYDQRGLGQSEKPDRPYAMADYADDAAALMADQGWDEALVLGVSFGGMVAQELALHHPRRVKRLVLACTSPGGAGGSSYPFHELHLEGEARARHLIPIMDTRRDAAWAQANPQDYAAAVAFLAQSRFADEPGRAIGARRQLEARSHHDVWDRLGRIACPTLIAAGRYDGIARPETQTRMAARIRGAELQWFEGGHGFLLTQPEAVSAVVAFLRRG